MDVKSAIGSTGILPVINFKKHEWIEPLCKIYLESGIKAIEVLFRNPTAAEGLKKIKDKFPEMCVGAGTVLSIEQAQLAIDSGADFIVCPGYDQKLVDFCNEKGILIVPGCTTGSEIQCAYASGLRILKFFPSETLGGIPTIRELFSPFSGVTVIPTNGIKLDNLDKYMAESRIFAAGGSFVSPYTLIESDNWDEIRKLCAKAVDIGVGFKLAHIGINCDGNDDAIKTADMLCKLFGFPRIEHNSSVFAGTVAECMKNSPYGTKGHIGIKTNNIDRAIAYLKARGVEFIPGSEKYDANGDLMCVYLKDDIAGLAVHIVK